jgi:hypothetical protein
MFPYFEIVQGGGLMYTRQTGRLRPAHLHGVLPQSDQRVKLYRGSPINFTMILPQFSQLSSLFLTCQLSSFDIKASQ